MVACGDEWLEPSRGHSSVMVAAGHEATGDDVSRAQKSWGGPGGLSLCQSHHLVPPRLHQS